MTPVELSRTVLRAVRRAVDDGELRVAVPERVLVTAPGPGGCGDYATNIALQLARPAGRPPREVAEILQALLLSADGSTDGSTDSTTDGSTRGTTDGSTRGTTDSATHRTTDCATDGLSDAGIGVGITDAGTDHLTDATPARVTRGITDVVITGPGFLNITLGATATATATASVVEEILRRGTRYGYASGPSADLIPLSCPPEVRAVVVMDALARILQSQGAAVRTGCEAPLDPRWVDILGVRVDRRRMQDAPALPSYDVRPVPAPVDPVPLGRDAARWALLHPAGHDRPRITDEHLVQRESNPLFRVRYAHARTRALRRNAADLGFDAEPGDVRHGGVVMAPLADYPRVLARAAVHRAPDPLARHLVTVADAVLPLLPAVLPRGAEKPSATHRARLALAEAAGTVLAGGLSLLGIDAPDHL